MCHSKQSDLSKWDGPLVDTVGMRLDRGRTLLLFGAAIAQILTEDEVVAVLADPGRSLTLVDQDGFAGRMNNLKERWVRLAGFPQERRDTGLVLAIVMTRNTTAPLLDHLHANLAKWRARVWPGAT